MPSDQTPDPELAGLEAQLKALMPRGEIDRDRLMFEAGARAARRKLLPANRLLSAACVLLAATAIWPLVLPQRADMIAKEPSQPRVQSPDAADSGERRELPNQLVVADSRELAAALADGRGDMRPARLRDTASRDTAGESPGVSEARDNSEDGGEATRPKSSRALLREYLETSTRS